MSTIFRGEPALVVFETIYLDWVRNVTIFIIAVVALLSFLGTHDIAYWLTALSIFILVVAQIDYFWQREELTKQGINIPIRIDLLWVASTAFLIILIWILCKIDFSKNIWHRN